MFAIYSISNISPLEKNFEEMSTDPGILLMILSSARFGFDQFLCFFVIALISELEKLF